MSLFNKLFGSRKPHSVRFAEAVKARYEQKYAKSGNLPRAQNEIISEFTTHFYYFTICPGKGDQIKEQIATPIEQILSRHTGVTDGKISADDRTVSFGFFAVCLDDDEVQAIESEIGQIISGTGVTFEKRSPERCTGCKRVVRHWQMIPLKNGNEVQGCPHCKTPKP